jgi:hypothetical protein
MVAHRRAVETVRARIAGQGRDQRMAIPVDRVVDIDEIAQSVLSTEEVRTALGGLPEDEPTAYGWPTSRARRTARWPPSWMWART